MTQTATNIEQSRKLLSLGIDPETADMCYVGGWYNRPCCVPYSECEYKGQDMPAWSLSALLAIIPEYIEIKDRWGSRYIMPLNIRMECGKWYVTYDIDNIAGLSPDIFSACIDLIEQLVKQGYIKTKKVCQ